MGEWAAGPRGGARWRSVRSNDRRAARPRRLTGPPEGDSRRRSRIVRFTKKCFKDDGSRQRPRCAGAAPAAPRPLELSGTATTRARSRSHRATSGSAPALTLAVRLISVL
ncbi:hypothetical protein EVAR_79789_1 [Eumeta japonica]|uniref:Uncharacterized protein n=1 Tax=Eumeta variegata TaxID=151549 RepID=A0A4C1WTX3_EUMVA|nr:hypothetical protein EVAR_79789_1 [Eumeta japonica]